MAQDILIQFRQDDEYTLATTWPAMILAKGEPITVFKPLRDGAQNLIMETYVDANNLTKTRPKTGDFICMKMGDGITTIANLPALYPFPESSFKAGTSRAGQGRDFNDLTKLGATHNFDSPAALIEALVWPYVAPTFTEFDPDSYTSLEVGQTFDPNLTYSWNSNPSANVKPSSVAVDLKDPSGTVNTIITGMDGEGEFEVIERSDLRGLAVGAKATWTLRGVNTKNVALKPLTRDLEWLGRVCWFMHQDTEFLISGMTNKAGEGTSSLISDANLVTVLQSALGVAARSSLGNKVFGKETVDGGASGARIYGLYPQTYKSSMEFHDPNLKVAIGATKSRTINLTRHGVTVPYNLFGLDLKIVGTGSIDLK